MRSVKQILFAHKVDMGGTPVLQPLPTQQIEQIDPFLLLHHHTSKIPKGGSHKHLGVDPHPHRGFSPVTFIFQGDIHHRDSRGNNSIVHAGGVQWMNAGRGIIHSERPSKKLTEESGTMEIIQLWVNTPKKHKMDQPSYQPFEKEKLKIISPDSGEGEICLIAGKQGNKTGPVHSQTSVIAITGILEIGAKHTFTIPQEMNAFIYILDGQIRIEGYGLVEGKNLVYFKNDGKQIKIDIKATTRFLLMGGIPLNEPLSTYGPFVMNTQTEIMEAMRDYQQGKMGMLIEDFD